MHFAAILQGDLEAGEPRRLKVVYVGHTAKSSGGELALVRLLPGLKNVDAHVVLGEDGPIVKRFRAAGASVEILPIADAARSVKRHAVVPGRLPIGAILATAGYTRTLARRLRELNPDVVHTNTLKSAIYGGIAGAVGRHSGGVAHPRSHRP